MPAGAEYLNHLTAPSVPAHSLRFPTLRAASFCCSTPDVVPVVRRLESKFRKPGNGTHPPLPVSTPPATLEQLQTDLAAKGRAVVSVAAELYDEAGEHKISATVEWMILRAPNQNGNA